MRTTDWEALLARRTQRVTSMGPLSAWRRSSLRSADARLTRQMLNDSSITRAEVSALLRTYHHQTSAGDADMPDEAGAVTWPQPQTPSPRRVRQSGIRVIGWLTSAIDGAWRDR